MSDADDPRNHPSYQPPPPPPPPFEQQPWAGAPAPQRPPQVTAAAVVLFVLAAINLLFGIAALAGVTGLPTGDFGTGLAIFSFVVAALQAVAGVTVLLRKRAGRILGEVLAAIVFFPALLSVLGGQFAQVIPVALNGFVLYALTNNAAYFRRSASRP